ncbi:MAG: DUF6310 domain-containing protein [Bacteroidia bacterium]
MDHSFKKKDDDQASSFGSGQLGKSDELYFKPTQNTAQLALQEVMRKMHRGEPLSIHDVVMTHRHADERFHNRARNYRNNYYKYLDDLEKKKETADPELAEKENTQDINPEPATIETDREKLYEVALALTDFDPETVQGFDEFKPGGFRYNPSKLYNRLMLLRQQTGNNSLQLDDLKSFANASDTYWFDTATQAGRIMYNQNAKAKHEGKKYVPSDDLIDQQNAELKTTDQLKHDVVNGVYVYAQILEQVQIQINQTSDAEQQKKLIAARDRITLGLQQVVTELSTSYQETVTDKPIENKYDPPVLEANAGSAIYGVVSLLLISGAFAVSAALILSAMARELADLWKDGSGIDLGKLRVPRTQPKPVAPPLAKPVQTPKPLPNPNPPNPFLPVPDLTNRKDDCTPHPIGYHRGGNAHHNKLADEVPPNLIVGTDWEVKGKAFDAWTGGAKQELWEIKTSENYAEQNQFIRDIQINDIKKDALLESKIAQACGKKYVLGVDNIDLYDDLIEDKDLLPIKNNIRHI